MGEPLPTFDEVVTEGNKIYTKDCKVTQEESPRCVLTEYRSSLIKALFNIGEAITIFLKPGEKRPETAEALEKLYKKFALANRVGLRPIIDKMSLNESFRKATSFEGAFEGVLDEFGRYEEGSGIYASLQNEEGNGKVCRKVVQQVRTEGVLPEKGGDRSRFLGELKKAFSGIELDHLALEDKILALLCVEKSPFLCNDTYRKTPFAKTATALSLPISVLMCGLEAKIRETTWDRYIVAAIPKKGSFGSVAEMFEYLKRVTEKEPLVP